MCTSIILDEGLGEDLLRNTRLMRLRSPFVVRQGLCGRTQSLALCSAPVIPGLAARMACFAAVRSKRNTSTAEYRQRDRDGSKRGVLFLWLKS